MWLTVYQGASGKLVTPKLGSILSSMAALWCSKQVYQRQADPRILLLWSNLIPAPSLYRLVPYHFVNEDYPIMSSNQIALEPFRLVAGLRFWFFSAA